MDTTEDFEGHPMEEGNAIDGYTMVEEMVPVQSGTILCCQCGAAIPPNPAAMCVNCIRNQVDITEGIPKQSTVYFCRGCDRYLNPPNTWINAQLESRELLALCLKRLKGLNKVRLIEAGFIWTEPHSKRIKVKITIQKEVMSGAILQQAFVVEYVVAGQFCTDCHRQEAADTWNAVVQVRQKVRHKKTFFHLEQLILKHNAHSQTIKIASTSDGIDFYFASRSDGKRMVEFLMSVTPAKYKTSERLISADLQSNVYNYKYTYSVEIVPICKDDIICLPLSVSRHFGGINQICICDRVGTMIRMIDPRTLNHAEISSPVFWRTPFSAICSHGGHTEFMIIDIEPVFGADGRPVTLGKYTLADATIARERDLGVNDTQYIVRTHLGSLLQPGDLVWGFDLTSANINDENANKMPPHMLPDVVLVKKSFSDKRKKNRKRRFQLKELPKEEGLLRKDQKDKQNKDFEAFLDDIEEDKEYRENFNLFKTAYRPSTDSEAEEDDDLRINVDELLDEFGTMGFQGGAAPMA